MELKYIYSQRKFEHQFFFDLVYEWEDVLMRVLALNPRYYKEDWSKWGGGR